MSAIPFGALFFAWCTLMAVAPLRRPRRLAVIAWISSAVLNELPFLFLCIVVLSAVPTVVDDDLARQEHGSLSPCHCSQRPVSSSWHDAPCGRDGSSSRRW